MTAPGRRDAVSEELLRADEELHGADQLLTAGLPRIAVTRAYFAAFHALRALLYAEELEPRTHAGVQHLFNLHLVRTGRYPPETSRLIAKLQKYREEADYADAFVIDADGAREEIAAARGLVERVRVDLSGRGGRG